MPASINDLIIKQGDGTQPIPTQLTAEKAVAATTASLAAATGWDTTTAKHVRMYKTTVINGQTVPDQSTISYYKATLSGTTLSNLTLIWSATGTDQKYDAGDTVDLSITSGYIDDLVEHLLVEHNQDGTHDTSVVATLTATQTLTNKTLTSPVVNQFGISSGLGAAWTSWAPTWENVSGGTLNYADYKQLGKTVFWRIKYTLAGAGVSGGIKFAAPVAPSTAYLDGDTIDGTAAFVDAGTARYTGTVIKTSSTQLELRATDASATYAKATICSSTIPFTWGNTDYISGHGHYEAA